MKQVEFRLRRLNLFFKRVEQGDTVAHSASCSHFGGCRWAYDSGKAQYRMTSIMVHITVWIVPNDIPRSRVKLTIWRRRWAFVLLRLLLALSHVVSLHTDLLHSLYKLLEGRFHKLLRVK